MNADIIDNVVDLKNMKGFKVVHLNCRSVLNKIDEMRYQYEGIDILACSETWLNDQIMDHMIEIRGMDFFRWDRQNGISNGVSKTRGGGVSCYINKKLQLDCHVMPNLTLTTCDIELLTLRCVHSYGKVLHIMTLYRPPDGSIESFFEILNHLIDDNSLDQKELWILGDYNIDFLKRSENNTKKLFEFLRTNGLKQYISVPTRLSGFSRSCIDLIVSNISENLVVSSGTLVDAISDHLPVFMCIKKQRNISEFQKIKGRTYRNYDKTTLQNLVKNTDWDDFYELENPIDLWNFILKTIEQHINIMCPIKFMRFRTNSPPWITQEVIEAINDRNSQYRQAKTSMDPVDLKNAHLARNRTNKLLYASKADYIKDTLDLYKDDPKKFWRILNSNLLKGQTGSSDITFNTGNDVYTNIADSCEYMNDHFAGVGRRLYSQCNNDEEIVFNVDDIFKVVKDIDVHKGSGIEYLPSFILKDRHG